LPFTGDTRLPSPSFVKNASFGGVAEYPALDVDPLDVELFVLPTLPQILHII